MVKFFKHLCAQGLRNTSTYSALKTGNDQRAWKMQLIHINAVLCHLMLPNWIQSHTVRVTWVRARGSKQGWYCLRMYFTEHQTMRSSHCQATDNAFNLVSHLAYDVLYNSISLLGKMSLKQEQSKYRKELRDVIKERNSTSPSCVGLFKQINTQSSTLSHALGYCIVSLYA